MNDRPNPSESGQSEQHEHRCIGFVDTVGRAIQAAGPELLEILARRFGAEMIGQWAICQQCRLSSRFSKN